MNEEQVEKLLTELSDTRDSFDKAIKSVRWNRINTIILYVLIALFFAMGSTIFLDYKRDQHATCERGNELRVSLSISQQENALSIGQALAVVFGGDQEDIDRYMAAYQDNRPEFEQRDC